MGSRRCLRSVRSRTSSCYSDHAFRQRASFSFPETTSASWLPDLLLDCTARLPSRFCLRVARRRRSSRRGPLNDPATGEQFHIEGVGRLLEPRRRHDASPASRSASSATTIDFKKDLGLTDQRFRELHLVVPARRGSTSSGSSTSRSSSSRTAITDARASSSTARRIRVGLPVNSTLDWKAYRFGYEYDFISRNRGFGGFILDAKYTDVTRVAADARSSSTSSSTRKAPIPAIGGIVRVYVVPNISITGELTGVKIPDSVVEGLQRRTTSTSTSTAR